MPEVTERRPSNRAAKSHHAPEARITAVYPYRLKPDLIEAVLTAAQPIPAGRVRFKHPRTNKIRTCSRSEAVINWLEWISESVEFSQNDLSPSALTKKLHAIAVAAEALARLLRESLDDTPAPQVQHALWAAATEEAEDDPDDRLHQILVRVEQLGGWCKTAEGIARGRIGLAPPKPDQPADRLMLSGMEQEPDSRENDALVGILQIWTEILGRSVTTAYFGARGAAGGPLIRFEMACLKALGVGEYLTPDALRERNRTLRRLQRSRLQKT